MAVILDQLLSDRYKVISALGAGGMGQTYVAEDTQRPGNPKCVVKQLKPASQEPGFLENARRLFRKEAEVLEKLGQHDRIPRLLAHPEHNGEFFIVQEFIEGHPLNEEMQAGDRWTEPQVIQLLQELLSVLEFVHGHNVIHRDIKPANIMRRRQDGRLVLIDFGAIKQVRMHQLTMTGHTSVSMPIGTPGYMPTEQASGKPRPSSDLYAVGMVAIQALTGMMPIHLRENQDGEIVWRDQAEVSDGLAEVLSKMVRHFFKHRYQSATEAMQALQQFIDSIPAPSYTPTEQGSDPGNPASAQQTVPPTQWESTARTIPLGSPTTDFTNSYQSPAAATQTNPAAKSQQCPIWIGAGAATLILSLMGGGVGYTAILQEQQRDLQEIEQCSANGDYDQCISLAQQFSYSWMRSQHYTEAREILGDSQLAKAQQLAEANSFEGAIAVASQIPPDVSAFASAQGFIVESAEKILVSASNAYEKGERDNAVNWAGTIPEQSPVYAEAQAAIENWNEEWANNSSLFEKAQESLNAGNWEAAIADAEKVTTQYWQEQAKTLIEQANDEKHLKTAQAEFDQGHYRDAIAAAEQVKTEPRNQKASQIIDRAKSEIARINRENDEKYLAAAQKASDEGRWQDAIEEAQKTVTQDGKRRAEELITSIRTPVLPLEEGRLDATHAGACIIFETGTLCGDHTFSAGENRRARVNQAVTITMESNDFTPALYLVAPNGNIIADSSDGELSGDRLSVTVPLPQEGTYRIRATSAEPAEGDYTVTVRRTGVEESSRSSQSPRRGAAALGFNYRIVVDADTEALQAKVREIVPDAFRTTIGGERVTQAGLFYERDDAEAMQQRLTRAGLEARILDVN
jgi:serine/threonine-protein kinase